MVLDYPQHALVFFSGCFLVCFAGFGEKYLDLKSMEWTLHVLMACLVSSV